MPHINIVTGGSGFIGSNLVKQLLSAGQEVVSIDNFSINGGLKPGWDFDHSNLTRFQTDVSELSLGVMNDLIEIIKDRSPTIWHLAANSDIQNSATDPYPDFRNTLGTTLGVLEIAKSNKVSQIIFASSSAVYGDHDGIAVSETELNLNPTSNYGVMKLCSEKILLNFCEVNAVPLRIFRFPNVIGTPLTHGVINDLFHKLIRHPEVVQVLGDGLQQKPFLHVADLIEIMIQLSSVANDIDIMNIGPSDNGVTIKFLAESLRDTFSPSTNLIYENNPFGWVGDIPRYSLDVSKMSGLFPRFSFSSKDAISRVILDLKETL
jgi:UDP-glucose 4-epimerase